MTGRDAYLLLKRVELNPYQGVLKCEKEKFNNFVDFLKK